MTEEKECIKEEPDDDYTSASHDAQDVKVEDEEPVLGLKVEHDNTTPTAEATMATRMCFEPPTFVSESKSYATYKDDHKVVKDHQCSR